MRRIGARPMDYQIALKESLSMNSGLVRTAAPRAAHWTETLGGPRLWAFQGLFLAALSLAAYVRIPLPFTPVPLTLQVFVVVLAGLLLGGRASLPVVAGYLALGAAGLPVFSGGAAGLGHLFGATGGYMFGFLLAAWAVGTWIGRPSGNEIATDTTEASRLRRDAAVLALGMVLIHGFGALWLGAMTRMGTGSVLAMAVAPFVLIDVVKIATAYAIYRLAGRAVGRFIA